jgi:tRNA nucleotidyltransferase/poly(A) polymerase
LNQIPFFQELRSIVKDGGYDAYLVGGCVRDVLLGREVHDVDMVCFSHDYKEFASAVRSALPSVWVEFKDNIRLVKGRVELDISKPRGENLEADLLERDFTINNLAMNFDGEIFGDRSDIGNKVIRHVSEKSFTDDPLRLLRSFRFMSQLGFVIADETSEKIRSEKELIEQSANERVYAELEKLFNGSYGKEAVESMVENSFYGEIFIDVAPVDLDKMTASDGIEFFLSGLFTRADDLLRNKLAKRLNLPVSVKKGACGVADFAKKLIDKKDSGAFELRELIYANPDCFHNGVKLMKLLLETEEAGDDFISDYEKKILSEHSAVDFETPMLLNGSFLAGLGAEPGPLMGEMIKETRPKLASGELANLYEAGRYIMDKFL